MRISRILGFVATIGLTVLTTNTHARDQIRIVGSSTVYSFATPVVEEFGATPPTIPPR